MKKLILVLMFSLLTLTLFGQDSGFSQIGRVTQEMHDAGFCIAHSSLRIGTKVNVFNFLTGEEIEATITKLIPPSPIRIADLSPSAWQALELTPDTHVRIYTGKSIIRNTGLDQLKQDAAKYNLLRDYEASFVAFSPDGKQILCVPPDNVSLLYEASTDRLRKNFNGHSQLVTSGAFSPDGRQVISGSYDNTIKLWDIDSNSEIRTFLGHT